MRVLFIIMFCSTGMLGCALAHEEVIREIIPFWLNGNHSWKHITNSCWLSDLTYFLCLSVSVPVDDAAKEYLHVYNVLRNVITLTSSTIKDPTALSELDKLQKILHG